LFRDRPIVIGDRPPPGFDPPGAAGLLGARDLRAQIDDASASFARISPRRRAPGEITNILRAFRRP
jgi:hypothetical protein